MSNIQLSISDVNIKNSKHNSIIKQHQMVVGLNLQLSKTTVETETDYIIFMKDLFSAGLLH